MEETEYVIQADKSGFKYAWASEHHFLEEYSHLSANDVFLGYLAHATERIHLGSGIFNPLAQVNHPVKVAEKVAMLDHLSGNRFEFGSGRGAGSHEILGFLPGITDMNHTKEIWEETIAEFPKMWLQEEYPGFRGKHWRLPPRKVLPKPYGKSHPAMWYAAGSPPSYAMAARKGLGVLGFSIQKVSDMEWVLEAVQDGDRRRGTRRGLRQRQRDGDDHRHLRTHPRGGDPGRDERRTALPAVPRLPLPRHLPAPRGLPRLGPRRFPSTPRNSSNSSSRRSCSSAAIPTRCSPSARGGSRRAPTSSASDCPSGSRRRRRFRRSG
ncbi:Alkanal monooxygenase alpha chain [Streptomyces sp. MBT84]|nr:Alkanal monooxygenase alpha chain [Streptomyces sp. MBT84]